MPRILNVVRSKCGNLFKHTDVSAYGALLVFITGNIDPSLFIYDSASISMHSKFHHFTEACTFVPMVPFILAPFAAAYMVCGSRCHIICTGVSDEQFLDKKEKSAIMNLYQQRKA